MNQSAILKKKGSNPNKAQSPLKNLDFDMQYRSTVELANKFKIKREQLANERNDKVKWKSVIPANCLDQFQKNQGISIDDETKRGNHTIADVKFMHSPIINEHNKGLDDLVDQEDQLGGDECDVEEEIDIDCSTKERKDVTFDKGQVVGPTNKIVSELSNFIGTIARNARFICLMYTSWHAVQNDTKMRMWKYINAELQNRQNFGETVDDAFRAVFGKEQPGRLRCYGRSVITSSLKKDEEINNLKQKHANEITSLKEELREEMQHLFTQLLQNSLGLNFQDIPGCVGSNLASPVDASSAQAVRGTNLPHSSGSNHDSKEDKIGRHTASLKKKEDLYRIVYT
ncbi:hypothetical protein KY285_032869 [Solanum tuberosum]|nr:hypothetical protein KY289_032980 [Solanum tuberosum]KAH0647621.1 hypothetical protein KY285_032869 [Solanum tuberosum]